MKNKQDDKSKSDKAIHHVSDVVMDEIFKLKPEIDKIMLKRLPFVNETSSEYFLEHMPDFLHFVSGICYTNNLIESKDEKISSIKHLMPQLKETLIELAGKKLIELKNNNKSTLSKIDPLSLLLLSKHTEEKSNELSNIIIPGWIITLICLGVCFICMAIGFVSW
ncbi:hypothetical protein MXB_2943 [Myxobolus squamalis]|nr:hypothetical protein MXB_2943 [Myxobolus squamalis]